MADDPIVDLPAVIKSSRVGMLRSKSVVNRKNRGTDIVSPLPQISRVGKRALSNKASSVDVNYQLLRTRIPEFFLRFDIRHRNVRSYVLGSCFAFLVTHCLFIRLRVFALLS